MGEKWKQWQILFSWAPKPLWKVTAATRSMRAPRKEHDEKSRQCIKKQRHPFANKCPYSQGYDLLSGHFQLWELDYEEGGELKNWGLQTVVLEKTPESPLDSRIKPVSLKGNQPWILIGRTDTEAETPVFWSSDANNWLFGKVPDAGKDWRQQKWALDSEITGWHHRMQWTWTWANFGRWWWTGRPGVLPFMGSQRVGHDWATELNWI